MSFTSFLALLAALLLPATQAFINPGFTPAHLVQGSRLVIEGSVRPDGDGVWVLADARAIKGALDTPLRMTVKDASAGFAESVGAGTPAVLLLGKDESGKNKAFCFAGGSWFDCMIAADGTWRITANNQGMLGTYAGDALMLARMAEHLANNPDALVPTSAGVRWHASVQVGSAEGLRGLLTLRTGPEGQPHLLAVAEGGDRILTVTGRRKFGDSTQALGLTSASRLAAILDADGDGHDDIASWDGAALRLHRWNGTAFVSGESILTIADCTGLEPMVIAGHAGLVINRPGDPLLLRASTGWTAAPLPAGIAVDGQPGSLFVTDLDQDGLPDVVQLGSTGSRLWKGLVDGFAPAVGLAIHGEPGSLVTLADVDGDGHLDILVSGPVQQSLWTADGAGEWRNVFAHSGWLHNKSSSGASAVFAADLNHDQWPDLGMLYREQPALYHFNRGFRTFAEEGEVRLEQLPPGARPIAATITDFNGDGASDLAVALEDGQVFVLFNDLYDVPALRVRLAADAPAAPATVAVHLASGPTAGHRIGTFQIPAAGSGTAITLSEPHEVELVWNSGGNERRQRIKPDPVSTIEVVLGAP